MFFNVLFPTLCPSFICLCSRHESNLVASPLRDLSPVTTSLVPWFNPSHRLPTSANLATRTHHILHPHLDPLNEKWNSTKAHWWKTFDLAKREQGVGIVALSCIGIIWHCEARGGVALPGICHHTYE